MNGSTSTLALKHCTPCREGMAPLKDDEAGRLLGELDGWAITPGPRVAKTWKLANFADALSFVNRIGAIAEAEDHHPDIALAWGRVGVELWTHAAGGLTENDFIVAAKIDEAAAG